MSIISDALIISLFPDDGKSKSNAMGFPCFLYILSVILISCYYQYIQQLRQQKELILSLPPHGGKLLTGVPASAVSNEREKMRITAECF